MSRQMQEVMQRRLVLLNRISDQRDELAEAGARWAMPLGAADQALHVLRFLRLHPVLVAGVAGLVVVRRRGVLGLAKVAWRVWKAYRVAGTFVSKVTTRL